MLPKGTGVYGLTGNNRTVRVHNKNNYVVFHNIKFTFRRSRNNVSRGTRVVGIGLVGVYEATWESWGRSNWSRTS